MPSITPVLTTVAATSAITAATAAQSNNTDSYVIDIELCKTMSKLEERRACLLEVKKNYEADQDITALVVGSILLVTILAFGALIVWANRY